MPPRKRSTDVEEYESDGGFIEDAPRSKKAKTSKTAINEVKKREGKKEIQLGMQKDDEGNPFWEISKTRRVQVSEFKGTSMVNLREFFEKDGKKLPTKKGISLPIDQFAAFVSVLPEIESVLSEKGETIPRPKYNGGGGPVQSNEKEDAEGDPEEEDKNPGKKNFEATSDEEDEG